MAVVLDAYPKLTKALLVKTGYLSTEYYFFYHKNGIRMDLTKKTSDSSTSRTAVIQLEDPTATWHPEIYELCAEVRCEFHVPVFLFGDHGVAAADGGVLGVAIRWMAPDSGERGVIPVGEMTKGSSVPCIIRSCITFPARKLRGTLVLDTIIYVKNAGNPKGAERFQAHIQGTVLGVLDDTRVIIDGNGSVFPVHEVSASTEPLWYVRCDWADPLEDKFTEENFCLFLNNAHKDFASLNVNEGMAKSPLLMEIICSSLQMLITKVMSDVAAAQAIRTGEDLVPGTIAAVVYYFMRKYGWSYDADYPEKLATDIRKSMMDAI